MEKREVLSGKSSCTAADHTRCGWVRGDELAAARRSRLIYEAFVHAAREVTVSARDGLLVTTFRARGKGSASRPAKREKRGPRRRVSLFSAPRSTWDALWDEIVFPHDSSRERGAGSTRAPRRARRASSPRRSGNAADRARAAMAPCSRPAERRRDAPFRSTAATTFTRAARIGGTFAARLLAGARWARCARPRRWQRRKTWFACW